MRTERELIEGYRAAGDRVALETLFRPYITPVYRLTRRILRSDHDAEDATQATFTGAIEALPSLRRRDRFAPWLYGIAIRTARRFVRSASAEARRRTGASLQVAATTAEPKMASGDVQTILKEVEELPEEYRLPILLHHCAGLSYDDIAGALGIPRGTVGTNIHRGLEKLRSAFAGVTSIGVLSVALGSLGGQEASAQTVEAISQLAGMAPRPSGPMRMPVKGFDPVWTIKVSAAVVLGAAVLTLLSLMAHQRASDRHTESQAKVRAMPSPTDSPVDTESSARAVTNESGVATQVLVPATLETPMSDNERGAIANMKVLSTAEADFRANDRDANGIMDFWTADVSGLYLFDQGEGGPKLLQLIPCDIARADAAPIASSGGPGALDPRRSHAGYWYRMLPVPTAREGRSRTEFAIAAYPEKYGVSGILTFVINQGNDVFWKDLKGSAPSGWPSAEQLETWMNGSRSSRAIPPESAADAFAIRERIEARFARAGLDSGDLNAWHVWDDKNNRRATLQELLGLDSGRWSLIFSLHERLLDQAKRLEKEKAQIHRDGLQTVVEIPAFPQEGLALISEWTRELDSILTPDQRDQMNQRCGERLFPSGLGQRSVRITLERFGELVRYEERISLATGEELTETGVADSKELPESYRHLVP